MNAYGVLLYSQCPKAEITQMIPTGEWNNKKEQITDKCNNTMNVPRIIVSKRLHTM